MNSPKLIQLSDVELSTALANMWSELKLISGVILYDHDENEEPENDMLTLQLMVLKNNITMCSDYMQLTVKELRHAFYMNTQGVFDKIYRHYNAELNTEFVNSVLGQYVIYKRKLHTNKNDLFFRALNPHIEKPKPPALTLDDWKELIQSDYDRFCIEGVGLIFNTTPKYEALRRLGYLKIGSRKRFNQWYFKAIEYIKVKLQEQVTTNAGQRITRDKKIAILDIMIKESVATKSDHKDVVYAAQRLMYFKFFEVVKGYNVVNLFKDIPHFWVEI